MKKSKPDTIRLVIAEYQTVLFLFMFVVAVALMLGSFLLTNTFEIAHAVAWIANELGLGIITAIIVVLSYEKFLHIRVGLYSFRDRMRITLGERFPRGLSDGLAAALDQVQLSESYRDATIVLEESGLADEWLVARVCMEHEVVNWTDEPQPYSFEFNSWSLDASENTSRKLRDGVYEVEEVKVVVGGKVVMDTTPIAGEKKLGAIQSWNQRRDERYKFTYAFARQLVIPPRQSARFMMRSRRYVARHNGILLFFPALPALSVAVHVLHPVRDFIESISYSFNLSSACDNCGVSLIEQVGKLFRRSYSVSGGVFGFQGIKVRWN